jgi:hypothetical protein
MAAAPLIGIAFSAAGQVAGMVSQGNQERAARAQSQAQVRHAGRVHELEKQRFNYAYNAAEQQYLQEAVIIQEQSRQARESLQQARIQQEMAVMQQDAQQEQVNAQLQGQVRQMLGAATAMQTEASGANAGDLYQLVSRLGEARGGRQGLEQRLTDAMLQSGLQTNAISTAEITDYQNTADQNSTRTRMADIQGGAATRQSEYLQQYANLVNRYMGTVNKLQNQMTDYTLNIQPTLLNLQQQRNESALSSARYANQAESNMGINASLLNYQNAAGTANAMSGGTGGGLLSAFGTLAQVVPQIAANWSSVFGQQGQSQPQFGTTPGFSTGYGTGVRQTGSDYSFGGAGTFPAPAVPRHRSRNPYSGNTQRGYS